MHKAEPSQNFNGTLADKAVKRDKVKQQQASRPVVKCGDLAINNVYSFKYLGSILTADADQYQDIAARTAQAMSRCGDLRHLFSSKNLQFKIKLRLYEAAVVSLLLYGSEAWNLDPRTCKMLRGANSRMLAWFSGNSIPHEARQFTTSFNIIHKLRTRRLRWVGNILRAGPLNPTYQALKVQLTMNKAGNLLADAPPHDSVEHLAVLAQDKAAWRDFVSSIPASN